MEGEEKCGRWVVCEGTEFASLMNASIKSLGATSLVALAGVTSDSSFKRNQSKNQRGGAAGRRVVALFNLFTPFNKHRLTLFHSEQKYNQV